MRPWGGEARGGGGGNRGKGGRVGFLRGDERFEVFAELLVGRAITSAVQIDLEIVEEGVGGLVAFLAVAREGFLDDGFQGRVDVAAQRGEARDGLGEDVFAGARGAGVAEDVFAQEQFGEEDAQRKQVGAGVGDGAAGLFRGEVFVFAGDDLAFDVVHEVEGFRDAEVGELHVAFVGDHDVFRADVAVDNSEWAAFGVAFFVGVGEPAGDARDDEGAQIDRDRARLAQVAVEKLLQVHTPHVLHYHEILAVELPEVVRLDDVGVDQIGDESGFADEVFLKLGDGGVLFTDELYGDLLAESTSADLEAFVDDAHAARRDLADEFVGNFCA